MVADVLLLEFFFVLLVRSVAPEYLFVPIAIVADFRKACLLFRGFTVGLRYVAPVRPFHR